MPTGNVTLYAKWTINNYTITFDKNDAVATGTMEPLTIAYGSTASLTVNAFVKPGWTFSGWSTMTDGSVDYTDGAGYTMGSADVTLFAKWTGWTVMSGYSGQNTLVFDMKVDGNGNTYLTGQTTGSLDGESITGFPDVFITKYNSSGIRQWTRLLGVASKSTYGKGLAIDENGNCYVTGYTTGALDGQSITGTWDLFVIKYDNAGTKQWTRLVGVTGKYTRGMGICVDNSNDIYVTGDTDGGIDSQTVVGTKDVLIMKYNASGSRQWTRLNGASSAWTSGDDIIGDGSGNIYVTGSTGGSLNSQPLTGTLDAFILKYTTSGTRVWTRQMGVSSNQTSGRGINLDSSGYVYVTGSTFGSMHGQPLSGTQDMFLVKYSDTGTRQWTRQLGASGSVTQGMFVCIDSNDTLYISGNTGGSLDSQPLTGTQDAFVTRYSTSGERSWTRQIGSSLKNTWGVGIGIDMYGKNYLAGYSGGSIDGQIITGSNDLFITTKMNQ
jgi:hypothetical protein